MLVVMYFRFRGTKQLLHWTIFLLKVSKRKPHYPKSFRNSQPIRHNSLNCLCNVSLLEILTIVLHYKVNKGKKINKNIIDQKRKSKLSGMIKNGEDLAAFS